MGGCWRIDYCWRKFTCYVLLWRCCYMSGKEYHRVHSSLITEPKIAGVTKRVFWIEVIAALLMFNYFRVHIMSAILIRIIFFVIYSIILNFQEQDAVSVPLWIAYG